MKPVLLACVHDDRFVNDALLFGVRGSFRPPGTGLEIGFSRTAMWCGDDRPCELDTFVDLLLGNDSALNEMENKKAASFDKLTTDFLALKPDATVGVVEGAGSTYCMISKPKETVDVLHKLLSPGAG